jgi:hypothetical protein
VQQHQDKGIAPVLVLLHLNVTKEVRFLGVETGVSYPISAFHITITGPFTSS